MNEDSRRRPRRPLKRPRLSDSLALFTEQPPLTTTPPPPPAPEVDRISALPDDALLAIVSRLPVEQWTTVSVVSRHWRRVSFLLPRQACVRFTVSTPHLLPLSDQFPHAALERCSIFYWCLVPPDAQLELLYRARDLCVRELILQNLCDAKFPIPHFALCIKSLTLLRLSGCHLTCRIPQPAVRLTTSLVTVRCRHLRTLELEDSFIHQHILNLILADCSALERLLLVDSYGFKDVRIRSVNLKHLQLKPRKSIASIVVDAPKLTTLTLQTRLKLHELDLQAPKTREVALEFARPLGGARVLIKGFLLGAKGLKSVTLSAAAVEVLVVDCWKLHKLNLSFKKLKSLSICLDIKQEPQARFLVKLLESCPSLSELNIDSTSTD